MVVDTTEISKTIQDQLKDFVSKYGDYDNQLQKYVDTDEKRKFIQQYNMELEKQEKLKNKKYVSLNNLSRLNNYVSYLKDGLDLSKIREKIHLNKLYKLSFEPTKKRMIDINNEEYKLKNYRILQITSAIYFLLFNIFTSLIFKLGFISKNIFSILFIISFLYTIFHIYSNKPFFQTYGEFSRDALKTIVGETVKQIGPIKECPKECSQDIKDTEYNYGS